MSPSSVGALLEDAARAWVHAEALGVTEHAEWILGRFRAVDAGDKTLIGKKANPLVALVAHFATGKGGPELEKSGWAKLGPYAGVALGALAAGGYDELAEYHRKRSTGSSDCQEYDLSPFDLAPFELLAIEKRTGVSAVGSKHPLLTSPLA